MVAPIELSKPTGVRRGVSFLVLALAVYAWGLVVVPRAEGATPVPSIDHEYASAGRSLTRHGFVYHSVGEAPSPSTTPGAVTRDELWVDVERDVTREAITDDLGNTRYTMTAGGLRYLAPGITAQAPRCHGSRASLGVVLGCSSPTEESHATVASDRLDGRPVIRLTTTGTVHGDESTTFTRQLSLDPATSLPVALDERSTVQSRPPRHSHTRLRYTGEFLASSSLAGDFFDPTTLGFTVPGTASPLRALPASTTIYWLGPTFAPGHGLQVSVLTRAEAGTPGVPSGYAANLTYAPASNPAGLPTAFIQVWPRAQWRDPHLPPCEGRKPVALDSGATVTITCPPRSAGPIAIVTYPDTVLFIGLFSTDGTHTTQPYAKEPATTMLLHALTRTAS